jgi:hypothetical protein
VREIARGGTWTVLRTRDGEAAVLLLDKQRDSGIHGGIVHIPPDLADLIQIGQEASGAVLESMAKAADAHDSRFCREWAKSIADAAGDE